MRSSSSSLAVVFSSLGLILLPPTGSAQQPTALPGVYVESATIAARPIRPPAPPADQPAKTPPQVDLTDTPAGISLDKVGSSVTVVTGQDLERQQIQNAHDALRALPGVSVSQQGTPGNLTVVRIRGAESRHTLVVIDGVEVNSGTDGTFDFSNLTTEDIEQIEVLRGPQSGLYGSGALGGVINIITKSGKGPLTVRVRAEAGSLGTRDGAISISGGDDRAHGIFTVYGRTTDGFNLSQTGSENDFGELRQISRK